jgi:uncharacterized membrane protein YhhN
MGVRHHRLIWLLAILAGSSYYGAGFAGLGGPAMIVWKGAGVALLALWAARQAQNGYGWMITAVMAFGALGDVLLDALSMTAGAAAFAVGHLIAIILYMQNRRTSLTSSQRALGWLLVPLAIAITWGISRGHPMAPIAIAYTAGVAIMAATAWTSRFPRYQTGIGAMLFLISDLLIFAGQGVWATSVIPSLLIWPLYFGGQALIVHGVVSTLMRDREELAPESGAAATSASDQQAPPLQS